MIPPVVVLSGPRGQSAQLSPRASNVMQPENADQFLVEQIGRGDQSAWRQLIDRYTGRLLAFARARTTGLSDAEDLVQETFVGFLQSLGHYDSARSLETYLFTIMRYKLYDLLRQRKVNVLSEPADSEDWWDRVVPGSEETPSGIAVQAEAAQQQEGLLVDLLRRLIAELRDRGAFQDLQVIELIFYAGTRNLDVAELLDMDQKAVAGVKYRAIQKLQKFLTDTDPAAVAGLDEAHAEVTVSRVWREHRLTCLKRSTLGSYLVGVLEEPWLSYTQFHLDVVGCPMCVANLNDLEAEREDDAGARVEQIFQSSIGFLSRTT
ncbi:MAG: sigma-70 family RNA polymerase sigma factor [Planctomycetes bacterium]|nr:sigma-70 family RNA polymerase sigma factor [Planctomycetota bacterium]